VVSREERLEGGYINHAVRVGDTVRREIQAPRPFVHDLLRLFEDAGWSGAPRFMGVDAEGREILSWISGLVPWSGIDEPPGIYDDASVAVVAKLVREFHDLTASSPLAGGGNVVCHNDLSPKNTVYRARPEDPAQWRPVAFIDWDHAAPGFRLHDLAHVAWQWAANATSTPDVAARLVRVAADSYGLDRTGRADLVDTILWWQDRCWRGIQNRIDRGSKNVRRLEDAGAVGAVRADYQWTVRNRSVLDAALA
jgi:hypothetical protein